MSDQAPISLHADLTCPAQVDTTQLDWVPSPMAGVERRMIEREGGEVARATSVVRYAPGSRFSAHRHDMGEEYLVLDGVFSDNEGDFPTGSYVRNPPGSSHAPHTDQGCVILVKLRQMPGHEHQTVHVDTGTAPFGPAGSAGHERQVLFVSDYETVTVERLQAGTSTAAHHAGGEEIFVLDGVLAYGGSLLGPGAWVRRPAGCEEALASPPGCRFWVKRGHLPGPRPTHSA